MDKDIRRKDRVVSDIREINKIISKSKILHMGLIDEGYPYVVPLHYGFEYNEANDNYIFYMHSAKEGHKIELIKKYPYVCVEIDTDTELILKDSPCECSSYYSSFIGRGMATIVENDKEKRYGLNLMMLNQTGKEYDFTNQMISSVLVIKIKVNKYSVKSKRR